MVEYKDLSTITTGSVVHYHEYTLDIHERKKLTGEVEGLLLTHILPNVALSADEIKSYYNIKGDANLTPLSCVPNHRIVLQVGTDHNSVPVYTTINLNEYFMSQGLQTVECEIYEQPQPQTPIQILGFNSYEFGSKFKT